MNGFYVKQDSEGVWHWMGVVTNNWLDRHEQIITAKAHRRFVEMVDSGEYGEIINASPLVELPAPIGGLFKEIADRGTPDLWYWHLPAPIGYATDVAFDERGYLISIGVQKEGEPYSSIFEAISKSDTLHGMSHGMPEIMVQFEMGQPAHIDGYLSTEFTVLPDDEAANIGTTFGVQQKEAAMQIPQRKQERIAKALGEDAVAQLDGLLSGLDEFAEEANIPRKETNMSDQEAEVLEEEVEEVETEEVEAEEAETEEAEAETEAVAETSGEDEQEPGTGVDMDPSDFEVPSDFKAFAEEMTEGLQRAFADFSAAQEARFNALQKQLDEQTAEIAQLKEAEGERLAEKAAETPVASMSGWMARRIGSVIGTEDARLNGSTERALYNKTTQAEKDTATPTGAPAPFISGMIQRQQGGRKHILVPTDAGQ